jgi:UDP-N-acetylglucosamine/UDP-N-acetylgalactosamine diphosphorylase
VTFGTLDGAVRDAEAIASRPNALPLHPCLKKVSHLDERGQVVVPSEPNAIKFERFIFDVLNHTTKTLLVEIDRDTAFAPVKNADSAGIDTPSSAMAAMSKLHAEWLRRARAVVAPDIAVEISPFFAIDEADLQGKPVPARVDEPLFLI